MQSLPSLRPQNWPSTMACQLPSFLTDSPLSLPPHLQWVLVVARRIFSCGMWTLSCSTWDLIPWAGIKLGLRALGVQSLSHWTTGKALCRCCSGPFEHLVFLLPGSFFPLPLLLSPTTHSFPVFIALITAQKDITCLFVYLFTAKFQEDRNLVLFTGISPGTQMVLIFVKYLLNDLFRNLWHAFCVLISFGALTYFSFKLISHLFKFILL